MNINHIEEIIEACKIYLKNWKQEEVDSYNATLLLERQDCRKNTNKYKELLKT